MIVKVKEPLSVNLRLLKRIKYFLPYFHFASDKKLTEAMMKSGAVCIAYETVIEKNGYCLCSLP